MPFTHETVTYFDEYGVLLFEEVMWGGGSYHSVRYDFVNGVLEIFKAAGDGVVLYMEFAVSFDYEG